MVEGHTILTADLDGDGNDEVIAGYRGKGRSVNIYRSNSGGWSKEVLDDGGMAASSCAAVDLNGDRKPDLVCIGPKT
jgi:FG-GAP-like repeat